MKRWKQVGKKLAAAFLALTLAIPAGLASAWAEEGADKLLVHYDFKELSGAVADGTAIKDISGKGNDATAKGNNLTAADGVLTLPGGAYGSGAGFVELPQGLFDGKKDLTVSVWMKNETGAGNYSAFYFGTDANENNYPTSYFILNPCNPSGCMKMVITNSVNPSAPYNTEVGPAASGNAADSFKTGNQWALYTTVFTEDTITGYLDGVKYKTYDIDRSVADLGTDLLSYIGKSPYHDIFYKGGVKDLRVYEAALTDAEVEALYYAEMSDADVLAKAAEEVAILEAAGGTVRCNFVSELTLVDSVMDGKVAVTWKSSNPAVISDAGVVTDSGKNENVTMTATLSYGEATLEKAIEISVIPSGETEYSMTIDATDTGVEISQELFGLFYEDINSAADGGLSAQLVKNNSFENYFNVVSIEEVGRGNQYSWKLHWVSDNANNFVVEQEAPLNANNTNYAAITGNMTLTNGGFATMSSPNAASMGIEKGQKYDFSIWTKAAADYAGTLKVQIVNSAGAAISNEAVVALNKNGEWNKSETIVLTGTKTQKGKIKLTFEGAKDDDVLYIDMVSLSSQDTYGYGDKNYSYGLGIRKDLVEMLIDLKPSFVRFPGGCIIEGNSGRESYYNWEWSVGALEERKPIANHWASDNGSYTNTYGYMQSFGFGYHEILQLCEDMGAEPFPILSAGVFCQFANGDRAPAASGEELDKFARHATHLIDYCWGDPNSEKAEQAEWAAKRVENGHEEPFNLNYVGIGNENWQAKYFNNFEYIKKFVEDYVAENYPGRKITIISSAGPSATGDNITYAWRRLNENSPGETLVDEHYYQSRDFMLSNDDRYDYYLRKEAGGSDVFLGEYATHLDPRNNVLESAICDAAYMTGIERNGDIVRHASYAPLFEKEGCANWSTNLIHFDDYDVMATPNYYVQQMYALNYGERIINTALEKEGVDYEKNTGSPIIGTWLTEGYITSVKVTREDGKVLLDEKFDGTSGANWEAFPGATGTFTISDGKLSFSRGSGMNCVWLPDAANNAEWYNYKVEVTAVKTGGDEGFLIGAGAKDASNYYWYNIGGWGNGRTDVEVARNGSKSTLGNKAGANYVPVVNNEEMYVTFNYGADHKIQAFYSTEGGKEVTTLDGYLRPYQNEIYQVSSMDDEYIYLKLVNHDDYAKDITLNYAGIEADEAEIICLSGNATDYNRIGNETVVPVTTTQKITDGQMKYQIPAMSFTVIKVAYNGNVAVNKDALQEVVDNAIPEEKADIYTEESWAVYADALAAAKEVLADEEATQAEVNDAKDAVLAAADALKEKEDVPPIEKLPYVDVTEEDWFYPAVYFNYIEKTMTGMDPTHFGPYGQISRAQFALILYRIEGTPEFTATKKFNDITGDEWYGQAVLWAAEAGIVTGYQNGSFGPADNITREQMAVMMYRYAKYLGRDVSAAGDLSVFTDVSSVSPFAADAFAWANGEGIITGKENGTKLDPQGNTARCEAAAIIERFMK